MKGINQMRNNTVGGYRIRAGTPLQAEVSAHLIALRGHFNEGLDNVDIERNLTEHQEEFLKTLPRDHSFRRRYNNLRRFTEVLWDRASAHQQEMNQTHPTGQTREIATSLIDAANEWSRFKEELDRARDSA